MTAENRSQVGSTVKCSNPQCNKTHSLNEAQAQANTKGLALAFCDDEIFHAIDCTNSECRGKIVFRCKIAQPVIDMRGLILDFAPEDHVNYPEQGWLLKKRASLPDFLHVQYIPTWDTSNISDLQFIAYVDRSSFQLAIPSYSEVPLFMSEESFSDRLSKELVHSEISLRRALPDNTKFRSLLTCLAPNQLREIDDSGAAFADGITHQDLTERRDAWKKLIEEAVGQSLEAAIEKKLAEKEIDPPPSSDILNYIQRELSNKVSYSRDQLREILSIRGYYDEFDDLFGRIFRSILYPICTELALARQRKELISWPEHVETGIALFIDAPMGLGKTYSIVESLASDPTLSAVIFMPTKSLCQEIVESLKSRIAARIITDPFGLQSYKETVYDDSGKPLLDEDGVFQYQFKREFLIDEVYYADGISHRECPNFDEFINRYKHGLFSKGDLCESCKLFKEENSNQIKCRFRRHTLDAPYSRIIVTTHQQYRNFHKQKGIRYWAKDHNHKTERNFFIVDEDIVLSQCYNPTCFNKKELKASISIITDFLSSPEKLNGAPVLKTDISNIDRILAQFEKCDISSVVPAIDPEFRLNSQVRKAWNESFNNQSITVPETLAWNEPIGNHLELIENAVRKGFAVQKYQMTINRPGKEGIRQVKKAFLPNPTSYDLSFLPPHVFFDGTMLPEKFLANKLKNVGFKMIEAKVDPIWDINVRQNIWTELSKSKLRSDQRNVISLLNDIFKNNAGRSKYFIVTKKDIRNTYLDNFLKISYPQQDIVINHFGNLRGENKAKDCDIGIMLGSFAPPDSVEIAMAIDFIQDVLPPNRAIGTKNNLWSNRSTNFRRIYKDKFAVIGEIADANRYSEHRQALARTRYLFHDVDFYIFSKDLVSDYDPFMPEPSETDYRADLFPARDIRPEAKQKFDEVAEAALDWLGTHETVTATEIHKNYELRRQTVGDKLKEMYAKGLLDKATKTKYRLFDN